MRLGLTQTIVEVEIKEEKEIDEEGEIDAAVGVTNKAIRLFKLTFTPVDYWRPTHIVHHGTYAELDHRGAGSIWTLTVEESFAAPIRVV